MSRLLTLLVLSAPSFWDLFRAQNVAGNRENDVSVARCGGGDLLVD
jgi:hypothetical protein